MAHLRQWLAAFRRWSENQRDARLFAEWRAERLARREG